MKKIILSLAVLSFFAISFAAPGEKMEYEKEYLPAAASGKTYKIVYKENPGGSVYYSYQYSRCSDRKYAYSGKLSTNGLDWKNEAPADSVAGYLIYKACGPSAARAKQTSQKSANSNSDLTDAKSKCSDLGFKKGTDQFGNCVLKLTK